MLRAPPSQQQQQQQQQHAGTPSTDAPPNQHSTASMNRMQLLCLAAIESPSAGKAPFGDAPHPLHTLPEAPDPTSSSMAQTTTHCTSSSSSSSSAATAIDEIQWSHFILLLASSSPPQISNDAVRSALASSANISVQMTTFWGHVVDVVDAEVLVEAVVAGVLPEFGRRIMDCSGEEGGIVCIRLGSGTVFVWEDSEKLTRTVLQKNRRWSTPWRQGQFHLSRELDIHSTNEKCVHNGFCKKWIAIQGSNGKQYKVISYFTPTDVTHLYEGQQTIPHSFERPSTVPYLAHFYKQIRSTQQQQQVHERNWQFCDDSKTPMVINMRNRAAAAGELKPFPVLDDLVLRQGNFQHHCIFQLDNPMQIRCPCGGLGPRKAEDYFRDDLGWMDRKPVLAPLRDGLLRKVVALDVDPSI